MSIPPLVCSTPPPPDQCEEDKDPDDFGISYGLSQEDDDDDGYNYGDFSSYNHYSSNSIAQKNETQTINIPIIPSDTKEVNVIEHENEQPRIEINDDEFEIKCNEVETKCAEDINIEDLCLEVNEASLSSNEKEDDKSETENDIAEDSEKIEADISDSNNTHSSPGSKNVTESINVGQFKETLDDVVNDLSIELDGVAVSELNSPNDEITNTDVEENELKNDDIKDTEPKPLEPNLGDDFGDYEDFKFVGTAKPSDVIENCDNPWDTNGIAVNNDFGNFTANFDAIESENLEPVSENIAHNEKDEIVLKSNIVDDDDEFGDFDDFKSSAINKSDVNSELDNESHNLPVLNLQTSENEHQVMESITNVLTSIFEEEIPEPESEFESKIESSLSETWRHLRETDVRQPYIVNWNNSLGQKTLLRALCIDSRNILFGPKWSSNMPKYAVNLSAAPLQPQKTLTPSNSSQSEAATNKTTSQPGGWTDPFTADGQESCSTESESVVEVTATDLDVFEAAISRKSDKIYSSTLNVQPLRQINLPDTHIFTPTDSETPTSKTVHYSNGPPILLPQTSLDNSKPESSSVAPANAPDNKDDDDYWEFQDFKSSTDKNSTVPTPALDQEQPKQTPEPSIDNATLKPNITYQTQVLLPIKMEPLMPTVNWPDPGHIKETFDDFSDFVSNSSWSDKPQQIALAQMETRSTVDIETVVNTNKNEDQDNERTVSSHLDIDDEFDTFQSALPTKHITPEFNFSNLASNTLPQESSQKPDFNASFQNMNLKSENISVNNLTRPSEGSTSLGYTNTSEIFIKTPVTVVNTSHNNLLQPTSTNSNSSSSQSHQKTAQILQPLSLESYSKINWPNPGIDLQDLSRFNPVDNLHSLKSDISVGGPSKGSSPVHSQKNVNNQVADDDWGEFVSSKPKLQTNLPRKPASFVDDDEWTDFVSSPSVKPQNGLNTISLNVHTNSNIQKSSILNKLPTKNTQLPVDIPSLNYITPKTGGNKTYNNRQFQNL